MNGNLNDRTRLRIACEISANRVIAARSSDATGTIEACTFRSLPAGSVTPSLTSANIEDQAVVISCISDVLNGIGARQHDVIAVIPDTACRIVLLDFDELPEKPQEADTVVRFRLKKSLPFDVDRARLSFDVRRGGTDVRVVAVVALASVIEEYESVLRLAGFAPGVVIPSTLAALGPVNSTDPVMVINIASEAVSFVIAHQNELVLFRTVELPTGGLDGEQLAEEAYPSLVFFQDTYGFKVQRILVGGAPNLDSIAPAIENHTGIHVAELLDSIAAGQAVGNQRAFAGGTVGALIS
jgi:type IV pilus assembly protein PilM